YTGPSERARERQIKEKVHVFSCEGERQTEGKMEEGAYLNQKKNFFSEGLPTSVFACQVKPGSEIALHQSSQCRAHGALGASGCHGRVPRRSGTIGPLCPECHG
uniref:Uncharacterized protein n=1 Tax=Periophthalmus magnuspinnatus TaxID=409849 RepID=A0A3B4AHN5_9GOBI